MRQNIISLVIEYFSPGIFYFHVINNHLSIRNIAFSLILFIKIGEISALLSFDRGSSEEIGAGKFKLGIYILGCYFEFSQSRFPCSEDKKNSASIL